jgi:putative serine protease PepD
MHGSQQGARSRRWLPWVALAAALVVGGVAGGAIVAATKSSASTPASSGASSASGQVSVCNVTSVADKVLPSVVTIAASGQGGSGTGSGEIIRSDGYILTNNHVIAVAANGGSVQVQFSDGQTERATITGRDSLTDLAVLKVDDTHHFPVIALGSSSTVKVGEASGGSIGLGFAIPVDLAKTISDEIIATGSVTHAYFGLQTVPVPPAAAAEAGVPQGLFVRAVLTGGPAAQAGLRAEDIITKINGEAATSNVQLQELTLTKKPAGQIPVEYWRNGHTATTTVTLGTQP